MKTHHMVRKLLRSEKFFEVGATCQALADIIGRKADAIRHALKGMPDAYIFKWVPGRPRRNGRRSGRYAQVWRVVVPPKDCPPPPKTRVR